MIRRPLLARFVMTSLFALACAGCGGGGESAATTDETTTVDGGTGVPQPPTNPPPTNPPPSNPPPSNPPPSNPPPSDPPPSDPPPSNPPATEPQPLPVFESYTGFEHVVATTVDPQTGTVFAIRGGNGDVLVLTTGESTPQIQGQIAVPTVRGLAFDPQQPRLFVVKDGGTGVDDVLHLMDPQSLQMQEVGPLTGCTGIESLAFRQDKLYAVDTVRDVLVRIDVTTAVPTDIGDLQLGDADIQGLAYDSAKDEMLGCDATSGAYVRIDTTTGMALPGAMSSEGPFHGMAYAATSDAFYAVSSTDGTLRVVDPRGSWIASDQLLAMTYDHDAAVLYGVHRAHGLVVRIDPTSGWKQPLGLIADAGIEGLAYDPSGPWLYALSSTTRQLYRMAPLDPASQALGVVTAVTDPGSLCFARNALFTVDRASMSVMRIDIASLHAITTTSIPGHSGVQSLTFDPARDVLLAYADTSTSLLAIGTNAGDPVNVLDGTLAIPRVGALAWLPLEETLLGTHLDERRLVTLEAPTPPVALGFDAIHALAIQAGTLEALAFDADAEQLVVVDVDAGTAALRRPIPGRRIEGAAVDLENDALVLADANAGTLLRMPSNGVLVPLGAEGALGTGIRALAMVPGTPSVLFGFDATSGSFVRIDTTTGAPTALGTPDLSRDIQAMTFDGDTQRILALDRSTRMLMEVHPGTGSVVAFAQIEATDVRTMAYMSGTGELILVDATLDQVLIVDRFTGQLVLAQNKPGVHRGVDDALATLLWPRGDVRQGQVRSFALVLSEAFDGGGTVEFRRDGTVIAQQSLDPEHTTSVVALPKAVASLSAGARVTWAFVTEGGKRLAEASFEVVARPLVTERLDRIATNTFYDAHAAYVRQHVAAHVLQRSGLYTEALLRTMHAASQTDKPVAILARDIRLAFAALSGKDALNWEPNAFASSLHQNHEHARQTKALLAAPAQAK